MENSLVNLKRKWIDLNPFCPEFVPQLHPMSQSHGNTQPTLQHVGWMSRGHTTWQYDVFSNRVVGGYYPQIRTKGAYLYDLDAVPFDPNIDVPMKVCFNCWTLGHPQQKCTLPKSNTYCNNCGRISVTVEKCPRCARAYNRYLLEKHARKEMGFHSVSGESDNEMLEVFTQKQLSIKDEIQLDDHSQKNESFGDKLNVNSVANQTEEGYFSNDGSENFDDYIVDEEAGSSEYTSGFVQDFMVLMETVKHLPMETQNNIIQQFIAERHKKLQERDKEINIC